jgi:hypothetical protein
MHVPMVLSGSVERGSWPRCCSDYVSRYFSDQGPCTVGTRLGASRIGELFSPVETSPSATTDDRRQSVFSPPPFYPTQGIGLPSHIGSRQKAAGSSVSQVKAVAAADDEVTARPVDGPAARGSPSPSPPKLLFSSKPGCAPPIRPTRAPEPEPGRTLNTATVYGRRRLHPTGCPTESPAGRFPVAPGPNRAPLSLTRASTTVGQAGCPPRPPVAAPKDSPSDTSQDAR